MTPDPETDARKRVLPPKPKAAALVALSFTLLLYLVELADVILPGDLDQGGIHSRELSGLDGVLFAPVLHMRLVAPVRQHGAGAAVLLPRDGRRDRPVRTGHGHHLAGVRARRLADRAA